MIWFAFLSAIILISAILFALFKLMRFSKESNLKSRKNKKSNNKANKAAGGINKNPLIQKEKFSCAFFHPNCSAGGGGERTLFAALISMKNKFPRAEFFLYVKANAKNQSSVSEIKKKAMDDFNLEIPDNLRLIPLKTVLLAESKTWPRFTLLGQIVGSIVLAFESMLRFQPDVLIDTAGFPFIYPVIKMFQCRLVAYVHYPFISIDMIQNLNVKSFNNSGIFSRNLSLRSLKAFYYNKLFKIYSFCGKFCDIVFTNSSWTHGHINRSWQGCSNIKLLFPPCDLTPFISRKLEREETEKVQILSLSQFRSEKNQRLQLEIAAQVLKEVKNVEFILIGGSRGKGDEILIDELKEYAEKLGITKSVKFRVNLPFPELLDCLQTATIGLHTMTDEHFGIGIVELMASGLITIANNSGGPRSDIIKKDIGFLCSSVSEYSNTISKIVSMTQFERLKISSKARENVILRFSAEIFSKQFSENIFNNQTD